MAYFNHRYFKTNLPWWLRDEYLGQGTNARDGARDLFAAAWEAYFDRRVHSSTAYTFMESALGLAGLPIR